MVQPRYGKWLYTLGHIDRTLFAMNHDFTVGRRASRAAIVAAVIGIAACRGAPAPAPAASPAARRAPPSYSLGPLDGSRLTVTVVEVSYAPGEKSKAHSHPCAVIGYIVEGAYRMQVKGEAEHVYTAGQTFYEPANGVHAISANASNDTPVRFLAYFTCDRQTPLTVPAPDSAGSSRD